jgi:hypothetical protein
MNLKGGDMKQNANAQPDAADHLRELRREEAEVRSRLVEVTEEVAAFVQRPDQSDLREAAQARREALITEMARLHGEIQQTEAELNQATHRQRIFLGSCGGGANSAKGFLDPPDGAHPSFAPVYPSIEIWAEDGDLILQLRANPPDTLPNPENLLDGLISFGELRTKRSLLVQTLSLWGELAESVVYCADQLIRRYEETKGSELNLD